VINIRVRFAPSPTGPLHIGGARTALFNYLFAKKNGGVFILRLEDTDTARNKAEWTQDIKAGLKWLGLTWDEEYAQSKRLKLYKKYADELLKKDLAYQDKGAIYFRVPAGREVVFHDLIRGAVSFKTRDLKDFPIIKSSGSPTFHFANVVDDSLMKISHVIRGEDHLSNTPLHVLLYRAFGFKPPIFAHIPLILNADRSKMSKRMASAIRQAHGAEQSRSTGLPQAGEVNLSDYIKKGFLPEAIINFLVQLGWSASDNQEYFTLAELIKKFDLNRVQKAGAVFDYQKLLHYNHHYLKKKSDAEYYKLAAPYMSAFKQTESFKKKLVPLMKERTQILAEIPELFAFFFKTPSYQSSLLVFRKSDRKHTKKGLEVAEKTLAKLTNASWKKPKILAVLSQAVEENDLQNGDLFWPVRVALSGLAGSPAPEDILSVLGRKESLARIKKAIKALSA
jgi:glutamyl-tRNA synthetase